MSYSPVHCRTFTQSTDSQGDSQKCLQTLPSVLEVVLRTTVLGNKEWEFDPDFRSGKDVSWYIGEKKIMEKIRYSTLNS